MRQFRLAAIVLAACHSTKPTQVKAPAPAPVDAGAVAHAEVAQGTPDAGPVVVSFRADGPGATPADIDRGIAWNEDVALRTADPGPLLEGAAFLRRVRVDAALRSPEPDTAAIAADAQACAADAHRSWAAQFPTAAAQLDGKHTAAEVYAQIGASGARALYLEAVCGATWARMQGFTPLIERRSELTAALSRVAQLAPELDGAGAEREMGTLAAALPSYAGGDLAEAGRHLEAAVQRAPRDSRNRLALARTVAVKAQDRALFEQQLGLVAKGDDPIAAADAAALLSREDDLFGPSEAAQPVPGGTQR